MNRALFLFLLLPSTALAGYAPGTRVLASPLHMDGYWSECVVVSGPEANDAYTLNCAAHPEREQSLRVVSGKWIKPAPQEGSVTGSSKAEPAAAAFPIGAVVLASPTQMASSWKRCIVRSGREPNDYFRLECVDEYAGLDGRMLKTVHEFAVPEKWIKANDPSFRPDLTVDGARSEQATRDAAKKSPAPAKTVADGPATAVATGDYSCWAFSSARPNLNFRVTGPGAYRAADGSTGRFSFDAGTKRVSFTGYLADVLPAGFTAVYHEPRGRPTVSFRGRDGAEASFCEKE